MIENIEFPGPILVFDIERLGETCEELYKNDYYPIAIIADIKNEFLKQFKEDYPKENIDCIIIPVRYLIKFLA